MIGMIQMHIHFIQIAILRRAYTIALQSISAYLLTMMISWILIAYSIYDLWRLMPTKGRIYGHVSNSTNVSLFYKYYGGTNSDKKLMVDQTALALVLLDDT